MTKNAYVVVGIVGLGLLSLYFIFNPSDFEFFPKCPLYATTGVYCPGCGSQRAIHNLLHFNIRGVFDQNALFIPAILLLAYHYLTKAIQKRRGGPVRTVLHRSSTPWILLAIILLFWVLRNLPYYPFHLLAPDT